MASFRSTFDNSGTVAQTVTTDRLGRGVGGLIKIATLATLTAAALMMGVAPLAVAWAAAMYGTGAAIQAQSTESTNSQGERSTFTQRFLRNLNPGKF